MCMSMFSGCIVVIMGGGIGIGVVCVKDFVV